MLGGLLVEGLVRGVEDARQRDRQNWQEWGIDEGLGRLETVFHREFAAALRDRAEESDHSEELRSIARRWEDNPNGEDLATAFDDIEIAFGSETAAVGRILAVISDRVGVSQNAREDLRTAIANAYREGLNEFLDGINSEDADLAREFQERLQIDIRRRVTEALDRLDQFTAGPKRRFERYDPTVPGELDELADFLRDTGPEETARFVDRSELEDLPDTDRLLVVGPAGSGKTRVLEKRARDYDAEVSVILSPKGSLPSLGQDEWAFEHDPFDGDVLLVWDDIHRIDENREDNRVFEDAVSALEETVADQGHALHVLAATRSGHISALPGAIGTAADVCDRNRGLWADFEPLELGVMDLPRLRKLARRIADARNVRFRDPDDEGDDDEGDERVLNGLVAKAASASAPEYIDTVCRTADGTLSLRDVESLPETAAEMWREQYRILRNSDADSDTDQLALLESCKLLYDLGFGRYPSMLVYGVHRHVLRRRSRDEYHFERAAEALEERQWVDVAGETYGPDEEVAYRLHDTQVEAVDESLSARYGRFSEFLFEHLKRYSPGTDHEAHVIHGQFATVGHRSGDHLETAKNHYEAALELTSSSGDLLDSTYSEVHNNYANLLGDAEGVRDVQTAKDHYEAALELTSPSGELLDSTYPNAHYNYANLLSDAERVRDVQAAKNHYEAALELTSPSGDLLDSTYSEVHNNYANLLKSAEGVRDVQTAKDHYERSARRFSVRGLPEHSVLAVRGLIAACAESASTPDTVRELYWISLRNVNEKFGDVAMLTAEAAWDRRTDLNREDDAYSTALTAGVWYALYSSLAGREDTGEVVETVQETIGPHLDRVSPTAQALYTLRFTDETAPTPSQLREWLNTDDYITALEIEAYERLLSTFGN